MRQTFVTVLERMQITIL